jgi:hypothetical protein
MKHYLKYHQYPHHLHFHHRMMIVNYHQQLHQIKIIMFFMLISTVNMFPLLKQHLLFKHHFHHRIPKFPNLKFQQRIIERKIMFVPIQVVPKPISNHRISRLIFVYIPVSNYKKNGLFANLGMTYDKEQEYLYLTFFFLFLLERLLKTCVYVFFFSQVKNHFHVHGQIVTKHLHDRMN